MGCMEEIRKIDNTSKKTTVKKGLRTTVTKRLRYMAVVLLSFPRWTNSDYIGWHNTSTLKTNTIHHKKELSADRYSNTPITEGSTKGVS
jgi:hypothetical protein